MPSRTKVDFVYVSAIVVFGVCTALLHQRTPDFLGEDAFYADAARNLLYHGFYGVNGNPETTQPPGLSAILAVLFAMFGYSYALCVRAMAVFEALGFVAAYEVLRRRIPSEAAGSICIVLMSSPLYFAWGTRLVYACFPYFFTTMVALLCGEQFDKANEARSRITWGAALTLAAVASLLIATGTIALLGAMLAVVGATALTNWRSARTRLFKFAPVVLVGIAVQAAWMHRKPAPLEWSLPGYPASYLQQIKVKNGNYPELGMAEWSDIPRRVGRNLMAESDIVAQLVLRHGVDQTKLAVVTIPVILIGAGWIFSVWQSDGMDLVDWYFAGYNFIYLLWPWRMEPRFVLPVAPLACLYIWRGGEALVRVSRSRPRAVAMALLPIALALGILGARWMALHWPAYGDLPDELIIPLWFVCAGVALRFLWTGHLPYPIEQVLETDERHGQDPEGFELRHRRWIKYVGQGLVVFLIVIASISDLHLGRENINAGVSGEMLTTGTSEALASEVAAGLWLRSHSSPDSVAMARHWPTVYHYAERRLVWFPPISDPTALFSGIVRHAVEYIVVVKHSQPYYFPDDEYCFNRVMSAHPESFTLVMKEGNLRIFRVKRTTDTKIAAKKLDAVR